MEQITIQYVNTDTGVLLELTTGFKGWKSAYQLIRQIEIGTYKVLTIKISDYGTDN